VSERSRARKITVRVIENPPVPPPELVVAPELVVVTSHR